MEGDFTFPTVAAPLAAAEERQGVGEVPFPGHSPAGTTSTSPLWPFSSSPSTTLPVIRATAVGQEEEAPPPRRGEAAADDQDRMDLLWEDFNINDDVERRAGPGDGGGHRGPRPTTPSSSSSDAESEETSTSGLRRQGCAPTMLRASSRAGGAAQFYASSTRRRRGNRKTSTGWALLMRLFRRLFAVDKAATPPPSWSRRHGIYVP